MVSSWQITVQHNQQQSGLLIQNFQRFLSKYTHISGTVERSVELGGPRRLKKFVEPRSGVKNFFSLSRGVWGHGPPIKF